MVVLFVGEVPFKDVGYVLRKVVLLGCSVGWRCGVVPVVVRVCHPL